MRPTDSQQRCQKHTAEKGQLFQGYCFTAHHSKDTKLTQCPSADEWISESGICVYTENLFIYEKNETLCFAGKSMELEDICVK